LHRISAQQFGPIEESELTSQAAALDADKGASYKWLGTWGRTVFAGKRIVIAESSTDMKMMISRPSPAAGLLLAGYAEFRAAGASSRRPARRVGGTGTGLREWSSKG
jgi:hypothetical protein